MPGTVAAKHGLLAGDRLIGYSGRTNLPLEEIQAAIQSRVEKPITLEIDRHGEHLSVPLTTEKAMVPEMDKKGLTYRAIGRIGIIFEKRTERMGIRESVTSGFVATYQMTKLLVVYLYAVMGRKMPLVLMGPVGVVHQMYQDVKVSWEGFLATAAALTVGLGFLNLLPIPPLDGSRLLITGLEAIRRKPFDKRKEVVVHLVGFALLLALVVVLTYSDILRIVKLGGG